MATATRKVAFKCKNCGHFETAGQAGERELPAACTTCGHGVHFDPVTGIKQYDDDNWLVLADLDDDVLEKKHGLSAKDVERHKPFPAAPTTREPGMIERGASESLGQEDRP